MDIEFLWGGVGLGGVGWYLQSFLCPTSNYCWIEVTLQLSWGFDNTAKTLKKKG